MRIVLRAAPAGVVGPVKGVVVLVAIAAVLVILMAVPTRDVESLRTFNAGYWRSLGLDRFLLVLICGFGLLEYVDKMFAL